MKLPATLDHHLVTCRNVIDDITYRNKEFSFARHFECNVTDWSKPDAAPAPINPPSRYPWKEITTLKLSGFDVHADIHGTTWFGQLRKTDEPPDPIACHWDEARGSTLTCTTDPEPNWDVKYDLETS